MLMPTSMLLRAVALMLSYSVGFAAVSKYSVSVSNPRLKPNPVRST